jgi:hypothetical protein
VLVLLVVCSSGKKYVVYIVAMVSFMKVHVGVEWKSTHLYARRHLLLEIHRA